jgi:hypothetical protein
MKQILWLILSLLVADIASAQVPRAFRSDSEGSVPRLEWYIAGAHDSIPFEVFRGISGDEKFVKIRPVKLQRLQGDTTILVVFDTTAKGADIFSYYIDIELDNKSFRSEVMFAHTMGYLAPPQVVDFTASPAKDHKGIVLQWRLNNQRTVLGLSLYRSSSYDGDYELVARLSGDATEYTDEVPVANEPWFYFLQIRDFFGYQPPSPRIHGFTHFAEVPYPPQNTGVQHSLQGNTIRWRGVGTNIIGYHLYRKVYDRAGFVRIYSQIPVQGEWVTLTDTVPLPGGCTTVWYYATAVSDGFAESPPGDTVVVDLSLFQPVVPPRELEAIAGGGGDVLLIWTTQEQDVAVAGYNLYRRTLNREAVLHEERLNRDQIAVSQNYFTDTTAQLRTHYQYTVESVNHAGNPSALRTSATFLSDLVDLVLLLSATQEKAGITLQWKALSDSDIINLHIYRQTGDATPVKLTTKPNADGSWTDNKTTPGTSYIYRVDAEDSNGMIINVNDGFFVRRTHRP